MFPLTPENLDTEIVEKILRVIANYDLDQSLADDLTYYEIELKGEKGVIAYGNYTNDHDIFIFNVPVLTFPLYGITLTTFEMMNLVSVLSDLGNCAFAFTESRIYFTGCLPIRKLEKTEISNAVLELVILFRKIRQDLLNGFYYFFQPEVDTNGIEIEELLPNIRITPKTMKVIYSVLLHSEDMERKIFRLILQKWSNAGFLVEATSQSVVLDIPYKENNFRIGILLGGFRKDQTLLYPGQVSRPATMVLRWESLLDEGVVTSDQLKSLEKEISELVDYRFTEKNLQIKDFSAMTIKTAKKFIKCLIKFANQILDNPLEQIVQKPSKPVSPTNIQKTLDLCDVKEKKIFQTLIDDWRNLGESVYCHRVGRIYLKLKTKPHESGMSARMGHKFNLLVLGSPKNSKKANIQVTWGLGENAQSSFLDNIPEDVAVFEKKIANLPGFEQKGTISRIILDDSFSENHLELLRKAIYNLRVAESESK